MSMNRRRFLCRLALFAGAAAVPGAAVRELAAAGAVQARPVLGLNSHFLTPQAIAQLRDLGIRHVRHTLYWPLWQQQPGYPAAFRENVARAHAAGLRLLLVVHNWAGGRVFRSGVNRRMMTDLGRFVAARAEELPQVEAWQLWNEQDVWVQAPFGASTNVSMEQRGRLYAEQMERAYPLIKRANPRALVVSGGTAAPVASGFLQGMMAATPPLDAVAIHVYGAFAAFRREALAAREIVGGHAPLWATEAGEETASDSRQLAAWREVVEGNDRERLVSRIYPYVLEAGPTEPGHGLLRQDGRQRPTYQWLRQRTRA
jgi:hypothetical protein